MLFSLTWLTSRMTTIFRASYKFFIICLLLANIQLFGQALQLENHTISCLNLIIHSGAGTVTDNQATLARMASKQNAYFSQHEFDEDLKLLARDFDRIEPTVQIDEENETIALTIHLWPKATIRSMRWCGNKQIKTSDLQNELGIKCFEVFDRQAFNIAFHKLKAYYMQEGFFEAILDYNLEIDECTNEVTITIEVIEGRSGKIQKIEFINFTEQEESELLKEMATKKYNLFLSWYNNQGIYNEEAIQQDKLVITNYLQNRGYADAQVEINVAESCSTNRIIVTIIACKGELYTFGDLSFEGNTVMADEEVDRLFLIRKGQPFSMERLKGMIELLGDAYGRLGYVDALIDFDAELTPDQYVYNIHFKIEEGQQFRVGLIRVFGNTCTKTSVILHETLMIPGEIFNTLKLKASERRLMNTRYFKNVNVYIVKGTESSILQGDYRDVYIEVEETDTGQFSAFLGYSNAEDLFAGFNITENNFNHEGFYYFKRDGLRGFRGGGEYANFTSQIGQKSRNYTLSWTKPYFMDSQWTIGFDLSNACARYISKDYDLQSTSLLLRANYNINSFLRFGVQYRLKNSFVNVVHHGKEISELEREANIRGLISAIGTSLTYDNTDHPIKPSQGFRSRLFLEYAGVGGDHYFFNFAYLNSYYFPVGSRTTIKYRADFRFIQPLFGTRYETVPLDERIFLGGEFNIRGFRPYRAGPTYPHHRNVPRGGLSLQFYSVEMLRRIMEDFELFTFLDAGHLSAGTWDFGRLAVSIGYGARFKLIDSIPPVTLGMGYPLNAHHRGDVKKFFFSFGGNF